MTSRRPIILLVGSFALAIMLGGALLSMPFSAARGQPPLGFLSALFTSTSAVCVTGLIVVDTPTAFSPIGHVIILVLIQLGGLGIVTLSVFFLVVAGRRVSIENRFVMQGVFTAEPSRDFRNLIVSVLKSTAIIEGAGAILLATRFAFDMPLPKAIWFGVFHAVSAFCNAGFSLFSDSFVRYRGDATVNITIMLLIMMGGIGFTVLREVALRLRPRIARAPWSLHSRVVLITSALLVFGGAVVLFFTDRNKTLAGLGLGEKALASLFQSVTARTAGFNTVDIPALHTLSLYFIILLMFIGASSGSTGGGVKTSTVGAIYAFARAKFRGDPTVHLFQRTMPDDIILRAFVTVMFALTIVFIGIGALIVTEPGKSFVSLVFEAFSAFGTVGLSMDITSKLSAEGRTVIIFLMFIGRVGALTLAVAVAPGPKRASFRYSEESVMIG